MSKHRFFRNLAAGVMLAGLASQAACSDTGNTLESITVYKSPTCGCCTKWISHLEDNGFKVEAVNRSNMDGVKSEAGIPRQLASCHTAKVGGYLIEGHVPAADIKRLLKEQPDVAGLTVPGMPMGSPGMEGQRKDSYDVLTFTRAGDTGVFNQY